MRVSDVLNKYEFTLVPVDQESSSRSLTVYDGIREKDLETILPKINDEEVVVLKGEHKGETGKILSRDKKKDEVIVQVGLTDIVKLSQDDICIRYE